LLTMLVTSYLQRRYREAGTDKVDLGKQLIDFFHLYGVMFNYDQVGISIRKDGCYFQKMKRGWYSVDDRNRTKLCVENP
jgi:non-canonical poly(A) RNA polymerase PAPD5/7